VSFTTPADVDGETADFLRLAYEENS